MVQNGYLQREPVLNPVEEMHFQDNKLKDIADIWLFKLLLLGIHLSTSEGTYSKLNAHKVNVEQHWVKTIAVQFNWPADSLRDPLGPSCRCMCECAPHPCTVSVLMEFRKICIAILPGYTPC